MSFNIFACMDFVVEGVRPKGRPNRTWKEIVEGDMTTEVK